MEPCINQSASRTCIILFIYQNSKLTIQISYILFPF